jgi:hypothetical protein
VGPDFAELFEVKGATIEKRSSRSLCTLTTSTSSNALEAVHRNALRVESAHELVLSVELIVVTPVVSTGK